jgi:predicted acyltransferase (DUF342 family)
MKKKQFAAVPLALMIGLFVPPAQADDRRCVGTIGAQVIDGSVIVPSGATCILRGTRVKGNVFVKSGATLDARGVRVVGSIQAENHRQVIVASRFVNNVESRSRINGDVQLDQGRWGTVRRAVIGGSLQTKQNTAQQIARGNVVTGDLQAFTNTGGVVITVNRINGNLQCKSNRPAPTGFGNQVGGNKEDQCRAL